MSYIEKADMSRLVALKDIDIPVVLGKLETLLGKNWVKQRIKEYKRGLNRYNPNKYNFWAPYFEQFYKWKERRKFHIYIPIPPEVAELGNWAVMISIFEKDWDGAQKPLFLH